MEELFLALALVLVIEGALYALFPDGMKRMMVLVLDQPSGWLRNAGLVVATLGVALAWLVRS